MSRRHPSTMIGNGLVGRSRRSSNEVQHHHTVEIVLVEVVRHTLEIVLEEVVRHKPLAGSKEGNRGRLLTSSAAAEG